MTLSRFSRIRRRAANVLVALGVVATSVVAAAAPASASATWCTFTSQVEIAGLTVPVSQYCFSVVGGGTHVDFTSGSFNGPVISNAGERVTFYDRNGNNYASWTTYSSSGNTFGYRYWQSGISGNAEAGGSVCGEMLSSGVVLGKICHRIS